jgi:hypothetical protein
MVYRVVRDHEIETRVRKGELGRVFGLPFIGKKILSGHPRIKIAYQDIAETRIAKDIAVNRTAAAYENGSIFVRDQLRDGVSIKRFSIIHLRSIL